MPKRKNPAAVTDFLDIDLSGIQPISENTLNKNHKAREGVEVSNALDNSRAIVAEIDPEQCAPWKYADRPDKEMGNLTALAESLKKGQAEPILVRPLETSNGAIHYEIIFGNRRWRAAKIAKIKLKAIITTISDQEASVQQELENSEREDISDFSRAFYYKNLLTDGIYRSESELAKSRDIARNTFNALMAYTRIPQALLNKINNPHNISIRLAVKLATLVKDEKYLKMLILLADDLSTGKITSNNLDSTLNALNKQPNTMAIEKREIVSLKGKKLFTLVFSKSGVPSIKLDKGLMNKINIEDLSKQLKDYIEDKLME